MIFIHITIFIPIIIFIKNGPCRHRCVTSNHTTNPLNDVIIFFDVFPNMIHQVFVFILFHLLHSFSLFSFFFIIFIHLHHFDSLSSFSVFYYFFHFFYFPHTYFVHLRFFFLSSFSLFFLNKLGSSRKSDRMDIEVDRNNQNDIDYRARKRMDRDNRRSSS